MPRRSRPIFRAVMSADRHARKTTARGPSQMEARNVGFVRSSRDGDMRRRGPHARCSNAPLRHGRRIPRRSQGTAPDYRRARCSVQLSCASRRRRSGPNPVQNEFFLRITSLDCCFASTPECDSMRLFSSTCIAPAIRLIENVVSNAPEIFFRGRSIGTARSRVVSEAQKNRVGRRRNHCLPIHRRHQTVSLSRSREPRTILAARITRAVRFPPGIVELRMPKMRTFFAKGLAKQDFVGKVGEPQHGHPTSTRLFSGYHSASALRSPPRWRDRFSAAAAHRERRSHPAELFYGTVRELTRVR